MKTSTTFNLSKLQPPNGPSLNKNASSVAPIAGKKGSHPLRIRSGINAGVWADAAR
jgi:hypothetical protein